LLAINIIRTSGNPNNKGINVSVGVRPKSSQFQNVSHQALRTPALLVSFHQRKNTMQKRIYGIAPAATLKLVPRLGDDFKPSAKGMSWAIYALRRDVNRQFR
jgi:hypothetical protein